MIVHNNCRSRNFLGCHCNMAPPQQSATSTLTSCNFPGPLTPSPPSQPSCHQVLTCYAKGAQRSARAGLMSHVVHMCSPAGTVSEDSSVPGRALAEGRGLGLRWMELQPQAKTVILHRLCQPRLPPHSRMLHTVDASRGRQIPVDWFGFVCFI